MLAGILLIASTIIPVLQPSGISQEHHVRRVGEKDLLWAVTTGAQLRPEEEATGARRTDSEQRSALRIATRLYWGQDFKYLSLQGPSHTIKMSKPS